MIVEWLGHAAVLATTADDRRILFDPYEPGGFDGRIAHAPIPGPVDVVVLSHHHRDHAWLTPALGTPAIVDRTRRVGPLRFRAVPAFHDAEQGARMGLVRLFALEADGARVVHLGDLGIPPSPAQVRRLGRPDVLLLPVGGTYTLDAAAAAETVARLRPHTAIPLHFGTPRCTLPLAPVEPFLDACRERGWRVRREEGSLLEVSPVDAEAPGRTGGPEIVVLRPSL